MKKIYRVPYTTASIIILMAENNRNALMARKRRKTRNVVVVLVCVTSEAVPIHPKTNIKKSNLFHRDLKYASIPNRQKKFSFSPSADIFKSASMVNNIRKIVCNIEYILFLLSLL